MRGAGIELAGRGLRGQSRRHGCAELPFMWLQKLHFESLRAFEDDYIDVLKP